MDVNWWSYMWMNLCFSVDGHIIKISVTHVEHRLVEQDTKLFQEMSSMKGKYSSSKMFMLPYSRGIWVFPRKLLFICFCLQATGTCPWFFFYVYALIWHTRYTTHIFIFKICYLFTNFCHILGQSLFIPLKLVMSTMFNQKWTMYCLAILRECLFIQRQKLE